MFLLLFFFFSLYHFYQKLLSLCAKFCNWNCWRTLREVQRREYGSSFLFNMWREAGRVSAHINTVSTHAYTHPCSERSNDGDDGDDDDNGRDRLDQLVSRLVQSESVNSNYFSLFLSLSLSSSLSAIYISLLTFLPLPFSNWLNITSIRTCNVLLPTFRSYYFTIAHSLPEHGRRNDASDFGRRTAAR